MVPPRSFTNAKSRSSIPSQSTLATFEAFWRSTVSGCPTDNKRSPRRGTRSLRRGSAAQEKVGSPRPEADRQPLKMERSDDDKRPGDQDEHQA